MLKESIWTWIYELQKKRGNSMLLGLDGVEIGLIIVFVTLFAAILSGFPVAFAIGGAGVIAFAIIAFLDGQGLLCLLYTSPSPRDKRQSRMPSSA